MRVLVACMAPLFLVGVGLDGDTPSAWPQFRGLNGSSIAEGQKPPVEFGAGKNLKWKVPAPSEALTTRSLQRVDAKWSRQS